jgi:hypothetical protein
LKKSDVKEGDRVRLTSVNTAAYNGHVGTIVKIDNDPYFPYKVKVDTIPDGYLTDTLWLACDEEFEIVGCTGLSLGNTQLELDFAALLGEDESPENTVYCNCLKPTIITNTANFVDFKVCTTCKKERA